MSFISEIISKKYLKEYLSRNKWLIVISTVLLIFSGIIGVIFSESLKPIIIEVIYQMLKDLPKQLNPFDEMVYIFTNNIRVNLIILLGGFVLSILSVIIIIFNGLIIGFTYTLTTPIQYIVGIFPHGIFEIPATALSLVGAFLITKLEINLTKSLISGNFKKEYLNSEILLKDILTTILLTFVLLVIAAIIESWITPKLLSLVI